MTAQITDHDRDQIENILGGYGDWFSAQLLRLIAKADVDNKELIRQVFPDHVSRDRLPAPVAVHLDGHVAPLVRAATIGTALVEARHRTPCSC